MREICCGEGYTKHIFYSTKSYRCKLAYQVKLDDGIYPYIVLRFGAARPLEDGLRLFVPLLLHQAAKWFWCYSFRGRCRYFDPAVRVHHPLSQHMQPVGTRQDFLFLEEKRDHILSLIFECSVTNPIGERVVNLQARVLTS